MRCELAQSELSVVNQEDAIVDQLPVAEHLCTKALRESPDMVPAPGEVEVGVLSDDVVVKLSVEDGRLGQVVRVIVDEEAATVGGYVEEIGLPRIHSSARALEQELVEGIFCAVEIPSAVWVSNVWRLLVVQ